MTDEPDRSGMDALLERLRDGAESSQEGKFQLDWRRAIEKIRDFRLTDPAWYVLELVHAAVASGATRIDVKMDADDMIMQFDGQPFTADEIDGLFGYLFSQDPSLRRLRHLAVGVNAGLGLNPKFLVVESGDATTGVRLKCSKLEDVEMATLAGSEAATGTRIHLRERMGFKVVDEFILGKNPEEELLAAHCRFAHIPMSLDGKQLNPGLEVETLLGRKFEEDGIRGEVYMPAGDPRPLASQSRIALCINGIMVQEIQEELDAWQGARLRGYVEAEFSRDASLQKVVHDEVYSQAKALVEREFRALLLDFLRLEPVELGDAAPRLKPKARIHWLRTAARQLLRACEPDPLPPELDALLDVPGLVELAVDITQPDRSRMTSSSLRPFWDTFKRDGVCRVACQVYPITDDNLRAYSADWREVACGSLDILEAVFDGALKYEDRLLRACVVGDNSAVSTHYLYPVHNQLKEHEAFVRVQVESDHIRGMVGLPIAPARAPEIEVTAVRKSVWMGLIRIPDAEFHATAVLESNRFKHVVKGWISMVDSDPSKGMPSYVAMRSRWPRSAPYQEAKRLVADAAKKLLRALRERFPSLPPSWSLPAPTPDGDRFPSRELRSARWHADLLVPAVFPGDTALTDWVSHWPLFYRLDGSRASLARLTKLGQDPVPFCIAQPWDAKLPDVLNLSKEQHAYLQGRMGDRLVPWGDSQDPVPAEPPPAPVAQKTVLDRVKALLGEVLDRLADKVDNAERLSARIETVSARPMGQADLIRWIDTSCIMNSDHALWNRAERTLGSRAVLIPLAAALLAALGGELSARDRVALVTCLYEDR